MDNAFEYVVENGGIDTEKDYRYWGSSFSFCNRRKQADRHVVTISGFEDVPKEDEGALAQAVAAQPVSVGICANRALQLYHSGVFDGECCTNLNHGVLAVGYGVNEDGQKFWKVKNSWGSGWGDEVSLWACGKLKGSSNFQDLIQGISLRNLLCCSICRASSSCKETLAEKASAESPRGQAIL